MNLFLKQVAIFSSLILLLWIIAIFYVYFIGTGTTTTYDFLYKYQIQKIVTSRNVKTVFIGDSSLGNSIDSDVFTQETGSKTMNLALTGLYGYAGSYNMLKRAFAHNSNIKNVIIMQTIDMQMREVSFKGYAYTINNYYDFIELSFKNKIDIIIYFTDIKQNLLSGIKSIFGKKGSLDRYLENDYIKQGVKVDFSNKGNIFSPDNINSEKNFFLKKIVEFCKKENLNLIYAYGPLFDKTVEQSKEYINASNKSIKKSGIFLLNSVVAVPNLNLGDSNDHIIPSKKKQYTKVYASMIKQYLRE